MALNSVLVHYPVTTSQELEIRSLNHPLNLKSYLSNIIEENLHKLLLNTLKWRMNISIEKTEICLFTRSNLDVDSSSLKVQLNGKDIPYNPHPKILGLHLDESLTFQNHIKKTEQKANSHWSFKTNQTC